MSGTYNRFCVNSYTFIITPCVHWLTIIAYIEHHDITARNSKSGTIDWCDTVSVTAVAGKVLNKSIMQLNKGSKLGLVIFSDCETWRQRRACLFEFALLRLLSVVASNVAYLLGFYATNVQMWHCCVRDSSLTGAENIPIQWLPQKHVVRHANRSETNSIQISRTGICASLSYNSNLDKKKKVTKVVLCFRDKCYMRDIKPTSKGCTFGCSR